jgi:2-polyprenyl-3-methyl-5-hydroxy-6-metoxy-1,4-benzoquinol methylase
LIPIAAALLAQNQLNEYIHPCGDDEREAVAQLAQPCASEFGAAQPDFGSLAVALLLVAMYRDPSREPWSCAFLGFEASVWPSWLQPLRDSMLQWQRREQQARDIARIGSVDDAVSREVQAQYEQNPYPHWRRCKVMRFGSIAEYLSRVLPQYQDPPAALADGCRVLSAGCGTGKEPIEFARSFPGCDILAIDLSSRSLAYAQAKAAQYGLKNIQFAQADILQLARWSPRFDVILSSGVLHHMQDTLHAWRILRECLDERGVMHVALYSRLGRTGVNVVRSTIALEQLPPDLAAIRAIRARCMSGQLPGFAPSRDFYSASACRDLLFHAHERQFDIPEIGSMLEQLSMRFLGFDTQPESLPDFAAAFPTPESQLELLRWHRYELSHPQAFGLMYSLWCTPEAAQVSSVVRCANNRFEEPA